MLMTPRAARRSPRCLDRLLRRLDHLVHTVLPGRHPRRDVRGDEPLRVLMPRGLAGLARESGIGAAMRHQEAAVRSLGHRVVTNPLRSFDVVHLNTPFPDTPLLARWARLWRRPVLVWAHSTEDDFRDSFPGSNRLAPLFRRWIAHLYRRGDVVITPSTYSRELISAPKYGLSAPIRVLSNGVDTGFFRPDPQARPRLRDSLGLPPEATVVISVGMQLVRKGILDWVRVAQEMPEVTFVWYGRTDPRLLTAEVKRALAGAPANALFPGYVRPEQLREAYCGAMPDGVLTHQVAGDGPEFAPQVVQTLRALLAGQLTDLTGAGRRAAEGVDLDVVAERLQEIYRLAGAQPHRRLRGGRGRVTAGARAATPPGRCSSPDGGDVHRGAGR